MSERVKCETRSNEGKVKHNPMKEGVKVKQGPMMAGLKSETPSNEGRSEK
jgi:hypothetical protein